MSDKSKRENSLFSDRDHAYHNLPPYQTNEQQQQEFANINEQIPSDPYPSIAYYQPYDYQTAQPIQPYGYQTTQPVQPYGYQINQPVQPQYLSTCEPFPTPVSKTPINQPSATLPPAPLGRTPQELAVPYSALDAVYPPMIPIPVQQTVVPSTPIQYNQFPPPLYYHSHPPPPLSYNYDRSNRPRYVTFAIRSDKKILIIFFF